MKRWLMILLFAAGGLATEIAHPVQCTLLSVSRTRATAARLMFRCSATAANVIS
ncbi:hypothetical protein [Burkholderia contaminans]|uniref:hypothetical protein n=1 Tax=Burkholderia contaminans TaxID=488447 RepID=UPI001CA88063|nr:hypothetical protein [Burkholderia contaminans]UAC72322.1 hypothetical protein K8B66_09115 [Burkholderia contaminans]